MADNKAKLRQQYEDSLKAELQKELKLENINAVPNLEAIVVNAGIGKELNNNSNAAEEFGEEIAQITGQKPVVTKTKKAVSNFKIREGMDNGLKVTLRGDRMWSFLDKLVNVALPRVKDFQGVSYKSFDGHGNYALGLSEQTVFPEIDTTKMVKLRPLQVVIKTTAENNEHAHKLLSKLGMPFKKQNN